MKEERADNLNDIEDAINPKFPLKFKIIIIILFVVIVGLLAGVIVLAVKKQKEKIITKEVVKEKEEDPIEQLGNYLKDKAGFIESWNELFGESKSNVSYAKNDKIENSFKVGGANYKTDIGEINNGKDYEKNERNIYDLYIPYSTEFTKDKHNGVILFIHGGSWTSGDKSEMDYLARRYSKFGYITATMSYTLLIDNYTDYNIFKIMDEITACIQSIKDELISRNYDDSKLELALSGTSAGAHIALLYGYSIANSPIPIKFMIDIVGPVSIEPKYWYRAADLENPLDSITPEAIETALNENKLQKVYGEDAVQIMIMNSFLGKKYTDEELQEMVENGIIKEDSPKYQEMFNIVKNAFPVNFINSNTVPTLCQYGGRDFVVGVAHYSFLYETFKREGIQNKIKLIYMKYGGHELMNFSTDDGLKAMKDLNYYILDYAKNYFTHDS